MGTTAHDLLRGQYRRFSARFRPVPAPRLRPPGAAAPSRRPARARTAVRRPPTRQALGPASGASEARVRSLLQGLHASVCGCSRRQVRWGTASKFSKKFAHLFWLRTCRVGCPECTDSNMSSNFAREACQRRKHVLKWQRGRRSGARGGARCDGFAERGDACGRGACTSRRTMRMASTAARSDRPAAEGSR